MINMTKEEIEKMANLFIAVMKNEIPDKYVKIVKLAYLKGFEYTDQQTKELQQRVEQLQAKINELENQNKNKYLTCVDCGKQDDTVKDRGAFNGIQCYSCKKEQDIDDEECR